MDKFGGTTVYVCSMSFNAFNLDKWDKCMCSDFHTQFEIILEKKCTNIAENTSITNLTKKIVLKKSQLVLQKNKS